MWPMPTPFGHEFAGTVAEVGEGVTAFRVGDHVMAAPTAPCGDCFFCGRGQDNLCAQTMRKMVLGAYADYLLVGAHVVARNMFIRPNHLPAAEAALLEPLSCVLHAQDLAQPQAFETVLIVGAGAFGLLHTMVLKGRGVAEVVVVGRGAQRLQWATDLGADRVFDTDDAKLEAIVASINGNHGPDLVIECTGQVGGWADAFKRVRRGGRVVFFGGCPANTALSLDTQRMHYDNLTLLSPFHFRPRDVRAAYHLLASGQLNAGRIINARRRLNQLDEVFAILDRGAALKCAVVP
jgi:L-iditol 2-dehydrogenase